MKSTILIVLCISSVLSQQGWDGQKTANYQNAPYVYAQTKANQYYGNQGQQYEATDPKKANTMLKKLMGSGVSSPVAASESSSVGSESALTPPTLGETLVTGLVWSARSSGQMNLVPMLSGQVGRFLAKFISLFLQIFGKAYSLFEAPINFFGKLFNPFGSRN